MHFTGNVRYETQGLLSPRDSLEKSPKLHGIEFLRFLAAVHFLLGEIFPGKHDDNFILATTKNIKAWGFTSFAFFCMLSGFVNTYNYAPTIDDSMFGFKLRHFLFRRLSWLFPLYLVALLLPIWADPVTFLSTFRRVVKFLATFLGISGWWPPAFRTYRLNDNAWMVSSFLLFYLVTFPLLLKPIHVTLSRVARQWLLLFAWPWTWFFGFVAEKLDRASGDYGEHWDWTLPVLYVPAFFLGMVLGSIFAERPIEHGSKLYSVAERFCGLALFCAGLLVFAFAKPQPMVHWHQTGSLLLLEALVVYLFANGKDVLGMIFSLFPFRILGGFAFPIIILMYPVQMFAKEIETVDFKVSFFSSLIFFVIMGRLLVQIPYARWSLRLIENLTSEKKSDDEESAERSHVSTTTTVIKTTDTTSVEDAKA